MEEKIYCKDLQKEIDGKTCHSHREALILAVKKTKGNQKKQAKKKTQICKKCPFNKSYPLRERTGPCFPKTFPQMAEGNREKYDEDGNPIFLFSTFTDAIMYKVEIPSWVINKLDEVFQKYLYDKFEKEKDRSLDRLFGCIGGRGQDSPRTKFERRERDLRLMTDIGMLKQRGIGPKDAAKIAENYREDYSPNPEKLRQEYHNRWKKDLDGIVDYGNPERIKDLLKSAPTEIKNKKKYLKVFGVSFDKPDSPAKKRRHDKN